MFAPSLLASVQPHIEELMLTVLVQLIVIISAARIFAAIFRRLKQPAVVGEIAAGLALGPSCFGYFFPEASRKIFPAPPKGIELPQTVEQLHAMMLNDAFGVLSQLGLILLLFLIGLEFDFSHLRYKGKAALAISLAGIALPFTFGALLAPQMHPHLEMDDKGQPVWFAGFLLFMGVAMSITAIPILGRMMMEMGVTRTRIGAITISSSAVDDACGWILLATISGIVRSRKDSGEFDWMYTVVMVAETIGFVLLMLFVARPLLKKFVKRALERGKGELGLNAMAIVLLVLFGCAIATSKIGIFAIFGAFLCGTVLSDEHEFREALSRQVRTFLTVFFLPIFFTYTGLRTNIGTLSTPTHWLMLAGVLAAAVVGKLGGCGIAAWLGGFSKKEALIIGTMMNTRALMELIVINVGRNLGVITDSVFCMLVLMALLTTVMTTPILLKLMPGTELEPFIRRSGFLGPTRSEDEPLKPPRAPKLAKGRSRSG